MGSKAILSNFRGKYSRQKRHKLGILDFSRFDQKNCVKIYLLMRQMPKNVAHCTLLTALKMYGIWFLTYSLSLKIQKRRWHENFTIASRNTTGWILDRTKYQRYSNVVLLLLQWFSFFLTSIHLPENYRKEMEFKNRENPISSILWSDWIGRESKFGIFFYTKQYHSGKRGSLFRRNLTIWQHKLPCCQ
jgi:hypothetical protein